MMMNDVTTDSRLDRIVELALLEDSGMGDLTSDALVSDNQVGTGRLICKEQGVIAGLEVAALVFRHCDPGLTFAPVIADGVPVDRLQVLATVQGNVKSILRGERVALNFLQRMSGIATLTRSYVEAVAGTGARIADTRKTAPGLRLVDKLAVRLGGGVNHRFGLDDMILIKDNHIIAAGGITKAVAACREYLSLKRLGISIEVETRNLAEVQEALQCEGLRRIMLDNFSIAEIHEAVRLINYLVEVEASGGITLANIRSVAETGVDFISVGALTHSAKALDISLELSAIWS